MHASALPCLTAAHLVESSAQLQTLKGSSCNDRDPARCLLASHSSPLAVLSQLRGAALC
jgi:hypothetical protein